MPTMTQTTHRPTRPGPALVSVDGREYPLRSAEIRARAEGGLAESTLTQRFANPHAEPLEVMYTMPLPADGAVIGYTITVGETVIRGEVKPRETARREYEDALIEGRTAGLVEQQRADTFRQQLGSVPAGVEVVAELRVLHPLAFLRAADDERRDASAANRDTPRWEYRFPTVVGARYHGGRVPDADKLDADRAEPIDGDPGRTGIPTRLEFQLEIADGDDPERLAPHATHHALHVTRSYGGGVIVRSERPGRLDRDLVLRWRAATAEVGARLVAGRGLDGDDGRYGLLTITPPQAADAVATPRDLTLLIDASGSMSGQPLDAAKSVAAAALQSLDAGDRFELVAFAMQRRPLLDGVVDATPEAIEAALAALGRLKANGGTEMVDAVRETLRPLRDGSQRQVVLLTDGYIGFEPELVASIARELPAGARLHTVGVGSAPNRSVTRDAARAGRGMELLVGLEDDPAAASARLVRATARPVLTELRVEGDAVVAVAPARPRDVLAGAPVVLPLELRDGGGAIEISGLLPGGARWSQRLEPAAVGTTSIPIGALYGREAVADAELADDGEVDARIETLGMRHRIATRRTSLIAVADEPTVDPTAPRRRRELPVELPAGLSAEGVGLSAGPAELMHEKLLCAVRSAGLSQVRERLSISDPVDLLGADGPLPSMPDAPEFDAQQFSRLAAARALRFDGRLVLVELDVPNGGVTLDDATHVTCHDANGRRWRATLIEESSTDHGTYEHGVTIRLAIRFGIWSKPTRGRLSFQLVEGSGARTDFEVELPASPSP